MPIPTIPQPVSHIIPFGTEPDLDSHDSRFGFHLPPSADRPRFHNTRRDALMPPLVGGLSNPPSNSSDTIRAPPIAPGADGGRVPIDPALFTENQPQSFRSTSVVRRSLSSQVPNRDTTSLPLGQVTGLNVRAAGTLGSDSSRDDDSEEDGADEFGVEYESNGGSGDELEGTGDIHGTHRDLHDPLLGARYLYKTGPNLYLISTAPGFDQSPSEDERLAYAQLRFSGQYPIFFSYVLLS